MFVTKTLNTLTISSFNAFSVVSPVSRPKSKSSHAFNFAPSNSNQASIMA